MLDHAQAGDPPWLDRELYPFASRQLQTSQGRIHYVDEGPASGDVVLLVHGTPSWSFEFRHLIPVLSATRRVIAIDHLGFGLSERPATFDYTPEAHEQVLREVIDLLKLTRFALVVHDYGGPIALPLAAGMHDRISALVVLNSWMWPLAEDAELARSARLVGSWVGRFMYRWLNASLRVLMPYAYADRRKLSKRIHAQYLAPFAKRDARERVLYTLARELGGMPSRLVTLWTNRSRLSRIPSLVVWGLGDRALPVRLLERWREALPEARVRELAGVGHWPQEEAPDEVARLLDGFLPAALDVRGKLASL